MDLKNICEFSWKFAIKYIKVKERKIKNGGRISGEKK